MIRVILETKENLKIADTELPDSVYELANGLDLLGNLDKFSYDCFSSSDMPALILELNSLKNKFEIQLQTVDEVINLANKCKNKKNLCLTFTPFTD